MTVDKNGNLTGTEKFNAGKIAQFGYSPMYHIMKEACALFGAGAIVDANNQPTMPAHWRTAMKFWHDAMWKDVWVPNGIYEDSQMFPEQETFTTGLVAMAQTHLWYLSFADIEKFDWDLYATPSYNGKITTPFDFDSFVIPKASKHQEEAFVVYQYLSTMRWLISLRVTADFLLWLQNRMPALKQWTKDIQAIKSHGRLLKTA